MKIPFLSFKMDTRRSLCLAFLLSFTAVVVRCETTSTTELPLTATDHSTDFTTTLTTEILTIENEALSTEGSTVPPLSTVKPSSVPPVGDCGGAVCGENEECTGGESPVCDCKEGYQRNAETSICEVGDCGGAVCVENEKCTEGENPVCDCKEGYQRNADTSICEVMTCLNHHCGDHEICKGNDTTFLGCKCVEGYQRNAETSICEVMTCLNHHCGDHEICKGNDTTFLGCECDNYSRLKNGFCEELSCDTTLLCHGPGDECIDHMLGYMCICNETLNRVNNPDQSDCIARTCNNSCTATNQICSDEGGYSCTCKDGYTKISDEMPCQARTCNNSCTATNQICSDEGGYNCTCQDGYTKISDDVPCQEIILPTTATTEVTPSLGDGSTKGPETPVITAAPPTPGPGSTQKQPPQSTKAPPQGPGSTQDLTPKKPPTTPAPKAYTGAIVGLFIFLVATCLVFVAIYLVRRRKLRNNYGRLDEDSEGDGGWSAFSKNPIYRGDKDYQPL